MCMCANIPVFVFNSAAKYVEACAHQHATNSPTDKTQRVGAGLSLSKLLQKQRTLQLMSPIAQYPAPALQVLEFSRKVSSGISSSRSQGTSVLTCAVSGTGADVC